MGARTLQNANSGRKRMSKIQMVDLRSQYERLKAEIDNAVSQVLESSAFIQGPEVKRFSDQLSQFLGGSHVVTCGNGTDALQISMMSLGFEPGDEVIIPAFTYVATAEVIGLLRLRPVLVDVDEATFNIDVSQVEAAITPHTRAVVPVHLFGQCASMQALMQLAATKNIHVIEDAAQSLAARYSFSSGESRYAGTMGTVGITSFFPSKTLGCFGDGGALFTLDKDLATRMKMIANHGQRVKYEHEVIGVNSRLDSLQAAVLEVKLKHIHEFTARRQHAASFYDNALKEVAGVSIPARDPKSTHVFHQYTLKVEDRDRLMEYLAGKNIPSTVYYPMPLHLQKAYKEFGKGTGSFPVAERLAKTVISLPIHTEITDDQLHLICSEIRKFYHA
jgi:UDP-2-acetamido-2-deoxy-ribo-hexuluronate aminotransferase